MSADQWKYPALTKPDSDGPYCYYVQRRISAGVSRRLANYISPNAATGIDLVVGIAAAISVATNHWLLGVVLIQVFGIFSCIDGEIARIQNRPSRMGDFLDTLTDRLTEFLLVGAIAASLATRVDPVSALSAGFALLGGVFLLTISSEKFRSAWHMAYPKRRQEKWLGFVCSGSDSRLLLLSIGLTVSVFTANPSLVLWLLWALATITYVNFGIRVLSIYRHYGSSEALASVETAPSMALLNNE